jgi:hypothetical protein
VTCGAVVGRQDRVWPDTDPCAKSPRSRIMGRLHIDRVMFQHSRATKEMWKFCNMAHVAFAARHVRDDPPIDWWERGAPNPRPGAAPEV